MFWMIIAIVVFQWIGAGGAGAADWPCFRHDNSHSGATAEDIETPVHLQWTHVRRQGPRPAWPEPCKEVNRTAFDYAPQVSIADGLLFYGSSADHQVHALDIETGQERWSFFTEGPVRFAPAVSGGRVFAASDDGCLYCLSAKDGELLWRFRGGVGDERMMGNGQMISRWPARAGVLIDGDIAYFTAGMWQPDEVYVYALDVEDGSVVWENNTSGHKYMKLPHSSQEGIGAVSPQGQLALHKGTLIVPGGRMMPAGFDRDTGKLLFCDNGSDKLHHAGGSWVTAGKGMFIANRRPVQGHPHVNMKEAEPPRGAGLLAWDCGSGEQRLAMAGKHRAAINGDTMYATGNGEIVAIDMHALIERGKQFYGTGKVDPKLPRKHVRPMRYWRAAGYPWGPWKVVPIADQPARKWTSKVGRTYELVVGGDTVIAGGRGEVRTFSADSGKQTWKASIDGDARGLAIADGRVFVSSTTGEIYCYGPTEPSDVQRVAPTTEEPQVGAEAKARAAQILAEGDIASGICLMVGAGDGELAYELAERSELTIYCIEPDGERADAAREMLDDAGVYGTQVAIHEGRLEPLPYADYCANLIVFDEALAGGRGLCSASELYRVLRPCGGTLYVTPSSGAAPAFEKWFVEGGVPEDEIETRGKGVRVVRGELPGADEWTHKYCDPSRPASSMDQHVRPPMKMLWFGRPGPARIISRHWRTPPPLFMNGRMFVAGEHHLMAVDAYNGRMLWARRIDDVGRYPAKYRGGQIVADEGHLYATNGMTCYRLEAATGRTVQSYAVPEKLRDITVRKNPIHKALDAGGRNARPTENEVVWEYLAVTRGLIVGSVGQPNFAWTGWPEAHPECKYVFALDRDTGKLQWTYTAEESVLPEAICIIGDRLYLIDRTGRATIQRAKRRGKEMETAKALKALDLQTGKPIWETKEGLGGRLLWSNGEILLVTKRHSSAYSADSGELLWSRRIRGHQYPVIIGDTFYLYPGAYDMRTGKRKERMHPLTDRPAPWRFTYKGGCGSFSGCPGALFCRSGAAGIYNLANDSGMGWLGQVRASCWVNMIAAGGMLLFPEGASSCSCPYNYQTSLAMVPDDRNEKWQVFPESGAPAGSRIRTLSANFGAVGDRRDDNGKLWAGFPRPFKPGALTVPMFAMNLPEYYRYNADEIKVEGTDRPWLYSCGARGLRRLELELFMKQSVPAPPCEDAPEIDGRLNDNCWDGGSPLMLTSGEQATDGKAVACMRMDNEKLYIAFRRQAATKNGKPVPWAATTSGSDTRPWDDDSFGVRLWDGGKRTGLYIHISNTGATYEGKTDSSMYGLIGCKDDWNGEWEKSVRTEADVWCAEIAVPWKTLKEAGMRKNALSVYLESVNHTGVGPERRQYKYRTLRRLFLFKRLTPVVYGKLPHHEPRSYDVRLRFAEPEDVEAGERVFDVKLQGETVIEGLDIVKEAGGPRTALVKTVKGIQAREKLHLELVPRTDRPAVISAIEVDYDEEKAMATIERSVGEGVVAHWSFDGEDADTAEDVTGNGHDGKIMGAKRVGGKVGRALNFDGNNDHVNCGNAEGLNITDELTVSAWVNIHSYHENKFHDIVLSKGVDAYTIFLHRKGGGAIRGYLGIGGQRESLQVHSPEFDEWHHIAMTVRDGRQTTYYDGAPASGASRPGTIGKTDRDLLIGYSQNFPAQGHFNGMIDEVRIYDRTLSAEEVQWLYESEK